MRTINKIITTVNTQFGAPMGRSNVTPQHFTTVDTGTKYIVVGGKSKVIFDCCVPLSEGYDKGGAYWGIGKELRVKYTKDLTYIEFYRAQ